MDITFKKHIFEKSSIQNIILLLFILPRICISRFSDDLPEIPTSEVEKYNIPNEKGKKVALIFVPELVEELHFIICNEILWRAGIVVKLVTIETFLDDIQGINQLTFYPTTGIIGARKYVPADIMIVPGGPGHTHLMKNEEVMYLLKEQHEKEHWIGAIGHGIKVLQKFNISHLSVIAACPPDIRNELNTNYFIYEKRKIGLDHKLLTCCNTGQVIEFALAIVEQLVGWKASMNVSEELRHGLTDDFLEKYGL